MAYWVTYNGRKNLKSAQMDVVVVSQKGVFMIEVKNWTEEYAQNQKGGLSPHEQAGRDGRVLWITLQNVIKGVGVTNILLSIKGNLQYDQNYRAVSVSSLNTINQFLEERQEKLSENEVKKIVKELKGYVTN